MYARTIVVLKLQVVEVLVNGLLGGRDSGGGLGGGRLGLLGVGGLGLSLADDDGHGGLPGLAVRELEQAEVEAGHGRRTSRSRKRSRSTAARRAARRPTTRPSNPSSRNRTKRRGGGGAR